MSPAVPQSSAAPDELSFVLNRQRLRAEGKVALPNKDCVLPPTAETPRLNSARIGRPRDAPKGHAAFNSWFERQSQMEMEIESISRQHRSALQEMSERCQEEAAKRERAEQENQELLRELTCLRAKGDSESSLRVALTRRDTSTSDLEAAILSVEAFVGEARRELQSRKFRERRAAFEELHAAMAKDDEARLEAAIAEARRSEVEEEDVEKAATVLRELQALTPEQKAAKAAQAHEAECKRKAFLLVKRDDLAGFSELMQELELAGLQWQSWKDHARRTLLQCAWSLRSAKVHEFLDLRLKALAPPPPPVEPTPLAAQPAYQPKPLAQAVASLLETRPPTGASEGLVATPQRPATAGDEPSQKAPEVVDIADVQTECPSEPGSPERVGGSRGTSTVGTPVPEQTPELAEQQAPAKAQVLDEAEEARLRTVAFRAVVKDDTSTLAEVILGRVDLEVWRCWENKAGKDLLTLSEERGSVAAYSMLAKALGLLKERRREAFEEREAVWVMLAGDVQPLRATVLEDTPAEADEVLLELWEGNEPAKLWDRDFVLKSA